MVDQQKMIITYHKHANSLGIGLSIGKLLKFVIRQKHTICLLASLRQLKKPNGFASNSITLLCTKNYILASMLAISYPTKSHAAIWPIQLDFGKFDPSVVMMVAIFSGAMSFALLSAFWLIRERKRISTENINLQNSFADLRADRERLSALVNVADQKIAVWDGGGEMVKVLGTLNEASGAPVNDRDFLAFGRWLSAASAAAIDSKLDALRRDAKQFNLNLQSQNGVSIEAQGRVSGGHAFIRFSVLEGTKDRLAKINDDHNMLSSRFEVLEKLLDKLPEPVWIYGNDGKLAFVNDKYAHAVEATNPEQAVSENRVLFDFKERELIDREETENGYFAGRLPAVLAGDRCMLQTVNVKIGKAGAGIGIDLSEIDLIRATLKHAIASQEQTFDHIASAVAIFDDKQRLQFNNSSFQQLWGLSSKDLSFNPTNSELLDILRNAKQLPEYPDWKKWKETQLEIYQSTDAREEHWRLPDGRTLRVIANPQNQGGASWVFENVTEQLELKSNYNSLMRVQGETLDHLNEAVAVFGSDGKIRLTNPAFITLWGFEPSVDLEGSHVSKITQTVISNLKSAEAWDIITVGITSVDDDREDLFDRIELNNGKILDYRLVFLPEGQSMLTLGDMTAAVNIERALKDRNDALEESDALKTRFIQHVSYELRAPLTSIAGFTEILSSNTPGKLNVKQSEYLEYISKSSDALKVLIDDILDLATIDAGAMQLDLSNVNLSTSLNECLVEFAETLDTHQIRIDQTIANNANSLIFDENRLKQIIHHLVSNAIAVSPDGGEIHIHAAKDGDMIELSVSDQGPGVPEDMRTRIFERFEGSHSSEKRRGTGIGLSIVKSFVELHGGNVQVSGVGERGAKFTCLLPIRPLDDLKAAE